MFAARFPARRSPRIDVPIPATLVVESDGKKARHESQIINVSERGLNVAPRPGGTVEIAPRHGS